MLSEFQHRNRSAEKDLSRSRDQLDRENLKFDQVQRELDNKLRELDYFETAINTVKQEFRPFYEKYIKTHNKSFESKVPDRT